MVAIKEQKYNENDLPISLLLQRL